MKPPTVIDNQVELPKAAPLKGRVLGQYALLEELGRGGFGCVYKAAHTMMDRVVALKVISPERVEDEKARSMFLREVRAATQLIHPNIAIAYDAGEVDGQLYMAMEFVEGPTLEQLVQQQGALPMNLAWALLQQAAQGLRYAHEQGMIHRDIKPANFLIPRASLTRVNRTGSDNPTLLKIVDFGLARVQSQSGTNTLFAANEKAFAGTPHYMSPEQARSARDVDVRSDLYSLGCAFYCALAGRRPFDGHTVLEIILQHTEREAEPLDRVRVDLPPALASIIRRLMEKQPARRFQTCDELLAEMSFLSFDRWRPTSSPGFFLPSSDPSLPQIALPPAAPSPKPAAARDNGLMPRLSPRWSGTDLLPAPSGKYDELAATAIVSTPIDSALEPVQQQLAPAPDMLDEVPEATPPSTETPAPSSRRPLKTLARCWRQWHAVVASLVHGSDPDIDPAGYKALHTSLLHEIHEQTATDPARQEAWRRLRALVEPWLNLQSLASTDPATARSLCERAEALATALKLRSGSRSVPLWLVFTLLLLVAIPLGAMASLQLNTERLSLHLPSPHSAWQFVQANPILSMALLLPASVVTGLYGLSRFAAKSL